MKGGVIGLVLLALISYCHSQRTKQGTQCRTPDSRPGICGSIRNCKFLLDIIKNEKNKPESIEFVRRSSCGYDPSNPGIPFTCCPKQSNALTDRVGNNLPSPPNCGITEVWEHRKVVGGVEAELGAWPWIAILGYRSNRNPGPSWKCGGALITKRYVVTAAHCAFPQGWRLYVVRLGELNLDSKVRDGATPIDIAVEKIISHESYSKTKFTDDIALVKLREEVPLSVFIQPICLPKTKELQQRNFTGLLPFVAGWGATENGGGTSNKLMEVQVPIQENEPCRVSYATKGAPITSKQLCAGYKEGKKDSCQGDSGGPLMWPKGENWYLLGVVSYGFKCAHPEFPGVYTRVSSYIDWISNNINK